MNSTQRNSKGSFQHLHPSQNNRPTTFFNRNALDQLKSNIEEDFKRSNCAPDVSVVPIRLLNAPSTKTVAVDPATNDLEFFSGREKKPSHSILKMTSVDPRIHKTVQRYPYDKSFQDVAFTTPKSWTTSAVTKLKAEKPLQNVYPQKEEPNSTVKELPLKSPLRTSIEIASYMKMAWEPILPPVDSVPTDHNPKIAPDFDDEKSTSLLPPQELNIEDLSKLSADPDQTKVEDNEKSVVPTNQKRVMKQKRVKCNTSVNPPWWRKEKQVVKKMTNIQAEIAHKSDGGVSLKEDIKIDEIVGSDQPHLSLNENKDRDNHEVENEVNEKSGETKSSIKSVKSIKKSKIVKSEEPVRQSTPKLRHYDQISVRRYIKNQREERRAKYHNDKLVKQQMMEEKKRKLQELQSLQKTLSKTPITIAPKQKMTEKKFKPDGTPNSFDSVSDVDDESSTDLLLNSPHLKNLNRRGRSKEVKLHPENGIDASERKPNDPIRSVEPRLKEFKDKTTSTSNQVSDHDDNKVKANEQLQSLAALYREFISNQTPERLKVSDTQDHKVTHDQEAKLQKIASEAKLLQKVIDEEMNRFKLRKGVTSKSPYEKMIGNVQVNPEQIEKSSMLKGDDKDANISNINGDSNISEGTIKSLDQSLIGDSYYSTSAVLRKIAVNTVLSKTKLDVSDVVVSKDEDWRKLLPAEPPDPQNFVNSWTRKYALDIVQHDEKDDLEEPEFETSKIESNKDLVDSNASVDLKTVATPTISQTSDEIDMLSGEDVAGTSFIRSHSIAHSPGTPSLAASVDKISSPHSISDDQISEGPLSSVDLEHTPVRIDQVEDNNLPVVDNDTLIEQQSLPSDYRELDLEISSKHSSVSSKSVNVEESGENVLSHYGENENFLKMMSPNTLRLRLSTELMYLDNVHESLGHLQDVERARVSSIAKRETMVPSKYMESQQMLKKDNFQRAGNSKFDNYKVLQTQAEAVKVSAEATKQLAELNKSLLENRSANFNMDARNNVDMTATVAATTSAAVVAALSQLKDRLQNSRKSRLKYNNANKVIDSVKSSSTTSEDTRETVRTVSDGLPKSTASEVKMKSSNSHSARSLSPSSDGSVPEELSVSSSKHESNLTKNKRSEMASINQSTEVESEMKHSSALESYYLKINDESSCSESSKSSISRFFSDSSNNYISSDQASVDLLTNLGEKSFQDFTLLLVKQNMAAENRRIKHQETFWRFRKQALQEKAKVEIERLKVKIKKYLLKEDHDKVELFKKREAYSMNKLKRALDELESAREREKSAILERRSILKHQAEVAKQFIVNQDLTGRFNNFAEGHRDQLSKQSENGEGFDVIEDKGVDKVDKGALRTINEIHSSKRFLANRERSIIQRRHLVEELLQWKNKLDDDEKEVQKLEKEIFKVSEKKHKVVKESVQREVEVDDIRVLELLTKSTSQHSIAVSEEFISELISMEHNDTKSNTSIIEDCNQLSDSSDTIVTNISMQKNGGSISLASISTSIVEKSSPNTVLSVSSNKSSDNELPEVVKSKSVILRDTLGPVRAHVRRRDSSGSEDSGPISQSETMSDASDIEGRILALKEDLYRRRKEAERLKKEQKHKTKERLKCQENSLLRQIEVYDRFINQTKLDLQKELEEDGFAKVVVKPVIKTPKVAENKRIYRSSGLEKSPDSDNAAKSLLENASLYEYSNSFTATKSNDEAIDVETKVQILAPLVNAEEILESPRTDSLNSSFVSEENKDDRTEGNNSIVEREVDNQLYSSNEAARNSMDELQSLDSSNKSCEESIHIDAVTDFEAQAQSIENGKECNQKVSENISTEETVSKLDIESDLILQPTVSKDVVVVTTTFETKLACKNNEIAERIMKSLLEKLLLTEIRTFLLKQNERKSVEKGALMKSDTNKIGQKIVNYLFDNLLMDSLATILEFYKRSTKCKGIGGCNEVATRESESDDASKRSLTFQHESYISQRINDILAEVNVKKCSPSKTRPQDMFVFSFNDAVSPPENNTSPVLGPSEKDESNSPVKRPSSPVLDESGETNAEGSSSDGIDLEVNPLHTGLGEDEWFDDDFGLSDGRSSETINQMRRYQVYPYQDFVYIREIPNKPPPPYTPPGQALNGGTPPAVGHATTNLAISKMYLKKVNNDIYRTVNYDKDHIQQLVSTATAFVYSKIHNGMDEPLNTDGIEGYFTMEDMVEDINNVSRRVYKEFLLTLVQENVNDIYKVTKQPSKPFWCRPKGLLSRRTQVPKSLDDLVSIIVNRISEILFPSSLVPKTSELKWGRKKRDFVDQILLQELRLEENEWITYDDDELTVKLQLSDTIFDILIGDTVDAVQRAWRRKHGIKDDLLVSD